MSAPLQPMTKLLNQWKQSDATKAQNAAAGGAPVVGPVPPIRLGVRVSSRVGVDGRAFKTLVEYPIPRPKK